jgi:hypothetical protein
VIAHEVEQQMRLAALTAEMNIGEEQGDGKTETTSSTAIAQLKRARQTSLASRCEIAVPNNVHATPFGRQTNPNSPVIMPTASIWFSAPEANSVTPANSIDHAFGLTH